MSAIFALRAVALIGLSLPLSVAADVYSYVNADGDYVITRELPSNVGSYVVLSDDGEFIERVESAPLEVPISHWKPWYLPREPNPLDPPKPEAPPEGTVVIEEVDEAAEQ